MKKIKVNPFKDSELLLACKVIKYVCKGKKVVLDATGCMGNMIAVSTVAETERILNANKLKLQVIPDSDADMESMATKCGDEIRVLFTLMLHPECRPIA